MVTLWDVCVMVSILFYFFVCFFFLPLFGCLFIWVLAASRRILIVSCGIYHWGAWTLIGIQRLRSYSKWASLPSGTWDLSSLTRNWILVRCIARRVLFVYIYSVIYVFIFVCAGSLLPCGLFSSWASGSCALVAVLRLLIAMASPVAEHRL